MATSWPPELVRLHHIVTTTNPPNGLRRGQWAYNKLHDSRPDITAQLIAAHEAAGNIDPFYEDSNLDRFWSWLGENWQELGKSFSFRFGQPIHLWSSGDWESGGSTITAVTYGHMVELAALVVEHYRGDLWHDALWLKEHLEEERVFLWGCDSWGTFIGADFELARQLKEKATLRKHMYLFELIEDNGTWSLTVSPWP